MRPSYSGRDGEVTVDRRAAVAPGAQLLGQVHVEVGERLQESFGMPQARTSQPRSVGGQGGHALGENRCAAVLVANLEMVWVLVSPLEARPLAEYPNAQSVFIAGRGHARPERGGSTVRQPEADGRVVEDATPGN